jgi:hypothetical protein
VFFRGTRYCAAERSKYTNMTALAPQSYITMLFTLMCCVVLTFVSLTLNDRMQSYVLVYWPYYSLYFGLGYFLMYTWNWKRILPLERMIAFSLIFQLFRQYEMFGEDLHFRDEQFRSDMCRHFLGHPNRWHCVFDEPMIYSMHALSEWIVGVASIASQNLAPWITVACMSYSIALSVFHAYLGLFASSLAPQYIAGSICSALCWLSSGYCLMKIYADKRINKRDLLVWIMYGFALRAIGFIGLYLHNGETRYERAHLLVYIDGPFHKIFMVLLVCTASLPLTIFLGFHVSISPRKKSEEQKMHSIFN